MSLLSGPDIKSLIISKGVFKQGDAEDTAFRDTLIQPASVDITIGEIFNPPDTTKRDEQVVSFADFFILPVGSTVLVKSQERVCLTTDVGGFVFPKNGHFALKGLMFTNFGHIDPGYDGYLKFTVINMGKQEFRLDRGMPIAGVVLFKLSSPTVASPPRHDASAYQTHARVLPRDFLDIDKRIRDTVTSQAKAEWANREGWKNFMLAISSALVTVLVSLIAIFFPFVQVFYEKSSNLNSEIQKLQAQIELLKSNAQQTRGTSSP